MMRPLMLAATSIIAAAGIGESAQHARSPLDSLPKHIRQLTAFGERAVWSADGQKIGFMSKSWGDAMEYDLKTRLIRNLTARFPHEGFLRIHYLLNGDYLLVGSERSQDRNRSRGQEQEFWILRANDLYHPIRLNQRVNEGVAVSRKALRISWTNTHGQYPDRIEQGLSVLYVAD